MIKVLDVEVRNTILKGYTWRGWWSIYNSIWSQPEISSKYLKSGIKNKQQNKLIYGDEKIVCRGVQESISLKSVRRAVSRTGINNSN